MAKTDDYWQESTPEQQELLDFELITELNEQFEPATVENHQENNPTKHKNGLKFVGFVTMIFFIGLLLANWLQVFNMPPVGFVGKSLELAQNQDIKVLQQAVVEISLPGKRGTGFNIHTDGLIVTNYHVVQEAVNIEVAFSQGQKFLGKTILALPEIDLAVINIQGENLPKLNLEDEAITPAAGDQVLIIGNPLGFSRVIAEGEIIEAHPWIDGNESVVIIKGPIYPGSSGSPIFNRSGKVVAVIYATLSTEQQEPDQVIGLAVPVGKLIQQLAENNLLH